MAASTNDINYGIYNRVIHSEDFKRLEPYLVDASRIFANAKKQGYDGHDVPFITLQDEPNSNVCAGYGYLCFSIEISSRTGNIFAAYIDQAKKGLNGPEAWKQLEEGFRITVYGEYANAAAHIVWDPDRFEWNEEKDCFVSNFICSEGVSHGFATNPSKRRKLIKAAERYWRKNNLDGSIRFLY